VDNFENIGYYKFPFLKIVKEFIEMEIAEVWNECIEEIKKKISKQQFSTWITPLSFSFEKESHTVIISAPNQFILQWVNDRFHDEIKNKFLKMNQATTIEFKSIKKQKINSQPFSPPVIVNRTITKPPIRIPTQNGQPVTPLTIVAIT